MVRRWHHRCHCTRAVPRVKLPAPRGTPPLALPEFPRQAGTRLVEEHCGTSRRHFLSPTEPSARRPGRIRRSANSPNRQPWPGRILPGFLRVCDRSWPHHDAPGLRPARAPNTRSARHVYRPAAITIQRRSSSNPAAPACSIGPRVASAVRTPVLGRRPGGNSLAWRRSPNRRQARGAAGV